MRAIRHLAWVHLIFVGLAQAHEPAEQVDASVAAAQNASLVRTSEGKGFGPQSPRDLTDKRGSNKRVFGSAPPIAQMNLCNIHFHKNAEHKGGEFVTFAGFGDGRGYGTGYKFSGQLSAAESRPLDVEICPSEHGGLQAGDTIEVHFVHSSARVGPGPTLNACLDESIANPQLRVEARVFVLVSDARAADFVDLTALGEVNGYHQALNIPGDASSTIDYQGSTTGPAYNEKASPLQASWSVGPQVTKVNAESVGRWCNGNVFKEDHAHGVRNLVVDERWLSRME
ncbi:MAG: hypothetical protein K9J04_02425 [Burkholderiales bacterium]|nr:hypothetical protein [Burkholderiales bacterium]